MNSYFSKANFTTDGESLLPWLGYGDLATLAQLTVHKDSRQKGTMNHVCYDL